MSKELDKSKLEVLVNSTSFLVEGSETMVTLISASISELYQGISADNYGTIAGKDPENIVKNISVLKKLRDRSEVLLETLKYLLK